MFSLSQHMNKITRKTDYHDQRCYRVHTILTRRAKVKVGLL